MLLPSLRLTLVAGFCWSVASLTETDTCCRSLLECCYHHLHLLPEFVGVLLPSLRLTLVAGVCWSVSITETLVAGELRRETFLLASKS